MTTKIIIFILLVVPATVLAKVNYCQLDCKGEKNIGCNKRRGLGSKCPKGARIYDYSKDEIEYWLNLDNESRNKIARGSIKGFHSASRMVRTTWSPELAKLATFNAQTCIYGHDKCRKTERYQYAGQNIGKLGYSEGYYESKKAIKMMFDIWFNEYVNTTMKEINSYPATYPFDIGHFTQIVRDISPQFGCGAAKYNQKGLYYWYLVCNYGTTNILGHTIYKSGKPCSECKRGCDKKYTALCTTREPVDPNKF